MIAETFDVKRSRNRLPYVADIRNAMLRIRRGQPWKVDRRGNVRRIQEHQSEVYLTGGDR